MSVYFEGGKNKTCEKKIIPNSGEKKKFEKVKFPKKKSEKKINFKKSEKSEIS